MARHPNEAKRLGNHHLNKKQKFNKKSLFHKQPRLLRSDWDDVKLEVMQRAVNAKFVQNKKLRKRLLATGDAKLIEDSRNDYYWGVGEDKSGENHFGRILMEVRKIYSE